MPMESVNEQAVKEGVLKKRRKRVRIVSVLVGIGLLAATWLGIFIYQTNPIRHFSPSKIPLFTAPSIDHKEEVNQPNGATDSKPHLESSDPVQIPSIDLSTITSNSFNLLLLGTDEWDGGLSRTDVIMVAHVIPAKSKVNILSIPRDTFVNVEGVGYTKLAHAHIVGQQRGGNRAGTELTAQSVSELLNIPIHYVIKVNFEGFQHLVDQVGGVEMYFDHQVELPPEPLIIPEGWSLLNGELALRYIRERYTLSNGDFGRQEHQADLLRSLVGTMLEPSKMLSIINSLPEYMRDVQDTNLSSQDMISLAWAFKGMDLDGINYYQLEGQAEMIQDSILNQKLWFWKLDESALQHTVKQWLTEGEVMS